MNITKLSIAALSSGLILGCATPFNDYEGTAKRVAMANLCESKGFISSNAFSNYASYQFGEYAHQNMQIVDDNKLRQIYLNQVKIFRNYNITDADLENIKINCAEISTVAQRVNPSAVQQRSSPSYLYTPPVTANCMTTYGWTRCTTN
ncbi:MAG: hypothetical protein ACYC4S_06775 [Rhodoferax sp.]